jgi:hypothetical protein
MEQAITTTPSASTAHAVDHTRGTANFRVSSQWWSRPDDQKFLSLDDMFTFTKGLADSSKWGIVESKSIRVVADKDDAEDLQLVIPAGGLGAGSGETTVEPTHWSFGQLASLVKAPAGYLRRLPATIAGVNLQYGLLNDRSEAVKAYTTGDDDVQLRAITGADYGRIFDHEIVTAVRRIAGNGTGDARWKVPGVLDWSTHTYDPDVPVSSDTTTLFASDRDVFIFLVDDKNPIEIGKLASGEPDLIFRGFFVYNSEVGSKSFGVATMYLRGVCCNRILWGVEGFQELSFRHSKGAPDRFMLEAAPALESFAESNTSRLLNGINAARAAIVASDDDERMEFLQKRKFSKDQSRRIIETVTQEEGSPPKSVWDFVQGITAAARTKTHQDERVDMERQATKLLSKVA